MRGSRMSALVLIAATILVKSGCSGPVQSSPQSKTSKFKNLRITVENYEKIKVGMKEVDVVLLLGDPVETLFSAPGIELKLDANPVDRISKWKDESGDSVKEIVAWIKDDQVLEKGQFGLIAKPNSEAP